MTNYNEIKATEKTTVDPSGDVTYSYEVPVDWQALERRIAEYESEDVAFAARLAEGTPIKRQVGGLEILAVARKQRKNPHVKKDPFDHAIGPSADKSIETYLRGGGSEF